MKENTYKVYCIENKKNKKLYFGITKRPLQKRMSQHNKMAKTGCSFLISRAIKKYGWESFCVTVIDSKLHKDEACNLEISLINRFKTCYERGYNMEKGGQTGVSLRPETKARKSKIAKKNWLNNEKVRSAIYSEKRLKKISEASKRAHKDPLYRKNFLSRHKKMVEASIAPGVRERAIRKFIENGFSVKVKCIELGLVFDSSAEASRWVKGDSKGNSNILACAKGRKKSAYGYTWEIIG